MTKQKHIRLLTSWILAAALLTAVAADAHAAGPRTWGRASAKTSAQATSTKKLPRPLSGEPDVGGSGAPNQAPLGTLPWVLRILYGGGVLILPKP